MLREFDVGMVLECILDDFGLVTDNDDQPRRTRFTGGIEHILDDWPPARLVKDFGKFGLHPLAFSRCQNNRHNFSTCHNFSPRSTGCLPMNRFVFSNSHELREVFRSMIN